MLVIAIFALAVFLFYRQLSDLNRRATKKVLPGKKPSGRLTQVLEYADRLFKESRYLPAERAYLEVIKLDHQNALAYSRLGMIYSRQKNYADAIECFQIAAQLAPSAASFHNLGLALFENKNNIKAVQAFEKSIMFEPSAERYASLSKAYARLANWNKAIQAAEKAVELERSANRLQFLAQTYKAAGQPARAKQTLEKARASARA